jgi:hypothetical protein
LNFYTNRWKRACLPFLLTELAAERGNRPASAVH